MGRQFGIFYNAYRKILSMAILIMNIKQLQSFLVLCDERHYGRAANRLFITQPTLSQQIKQLETSLKTILFRRKGRNIELTKAGAILQQHAEKIMLALKNG